MVINMTFNQLVTPVANHFLERAPVERPIETAGENNPAFSDFLRAAFDTVKEVNKYQFAADEAQINFATGKDDNVLAVILAQERAFTSLNFTVQITNKIIESYREIMRMQI